MWSVHVSCLNSTASFFSTAISNLPICFKRYYRSYFLHISDIDRCHGDLVPVIRWFGIAPSRKQRITRPSKITHVDNYNSYCVLMISPAHLSPTFWSIGQAPAIVNHEGTKLPAIRGRFVRNGRGLHHYTGLYHVRVPIHTHVCVYVWVPYWSSRLMHKAGTFNTVFTQFAIWHFRWNTAVFRLKCHIANSSLLK